MRLTGGKATGFSADRNSAVYFVSLAAVSFTGQKGEAGGFLPIESENRWRGVLRVCLGVSCSVDCRRAGHPTGLRAFHWHCSDDLWNGRAGRDSSHSPLADWQGLGDVD